MDWVKPKHRARQTSKAGASESQVTASTWLKQLCEENVAMLQSSIPVRESQGKTKAAKVLPDAYLRAMLWGTGVWEVESHSHPEFLNDLVEAFGIASTAAPTIRKGSKSKLS
ncbi:MAG: hypothetical protein K9M08_19105, partial [Pirellula sp.]|nr:hypothetical protein [Pirellula sp.]